MRFHCDQFFNVCAKINYHKIEFALKSNTQNHISCEFVF